MELLRSFAVGMITGAIFSAVRLPIPAPTALAGISGILGIWVGYVLVKKFIYGG